MAVPQFEFIDGIGSPPLQEEGWPKAGVVL